MVVLGVGRGSELEATVMAASFVMRGRKLGSGSDEEEKEEDS